MFIVSKALKKLNVGVAQHECGTGRECSQKVPADGYLTNMVCVSAASNSTQQLHFWPVRTHTVAFALLRAGGICYRLLRA